jgi:GDPmannose 4,6-dehydratase
MRKKALIFGITGQDGSYLAEFLLKKNYIVHGVKRKSSSFNQGRIDNIYSVYNNKNLFLYYGDLLDTNSIYKIIKDIKPDEIYNLAAQSHVAVSFNISEYTMNVDALGVLRILECIKILNLTKKTKFYQAGSSEMFGRVKETPQTELTPFNPQSPYAVAKTAAHYITTLYRDAYKMFAVNGILFNHESPRRGETFVTRKIVTALCQIKNRKKKILILGNLHAKRDWGHAKDYVRAMWLMLQKKTPDDYVIATGKQYSVKYFVTLVANELNLKIKWNGKGINEKGIDSSGNCIIKCSKKYLRPAEVDSLLGDSRKAKKELKWKSKYSIKNLVKDMVSEELKKYQP